MHSLTVIYLLCDGKAVTICNLRAKITRATITRWCMPPVTEVDANAVPGPDARWTLANTECQITNKVGTSGTHQQQVEQRSISLRLLSILYWEVPNALRSATPKPEQRIRVIAYDLTPGSRCAVMVYLIRTIRTLPPTDLLLY